MAMPKMTATRTISILLAAGLLLGGCGFVESNQDRIDKARSALASHKYRVAEIQLKNVLQKDSSNGEAWLLLARVSLASSEYADAAVQFRRATDAGMDSKNFAVPMARALIGNGDSKQALELLDPNTAADPSKRAELLALRGQAYLGLKQPKAAAGAFDKALAAQPDFADALVGKARIADIKGDHETAKRFAAKAVAAHPNDAAALEAQGRLAYGENSCAQAIPVFTRLLAIDDPQMSVERLFTARSFLADCQLRTGHIKDAETQIATLMKQGPDTAFSNYLQALIDVRHKDYNQATTHLQRFLKVAPNNVRGLNMLASVKIAQKDPRSAELYLNEAIAQAPGNARAIRMLAALYLQQDQADRAVDLLQNARQDNPNNPDLRAMLAEALARSGDTQGALDYVRNNTQLGDGDPALQMDVARAMARAGDAKAALALLNGVKSIKPDDRLEAVLLKISVYLQNKDVDNAIAAAKDLVAQNSSDTRRLRLLASTYVAAGRNDDARGALERAHKASPEDTSVVLGLGLLALREKDYAGAEKRFRDVLAKHPDDLKAMIAMTQSSALQGNNDAAQQWLEKARAAHPDNVKIQIALVRVYLSTQRRDKAKALLKDALAAHPDSAELHRLQGMVLLASGQTQPALDSLQRAVDQAPDMPVYRLDLARAQLASDKSDAAIETLEALRKQSPRFLAAVPDLALAQLRAGQPDAAMATADSLNQATGSDTAAETLKGDLLGAQEKYAQAADAYAKAYTAEPTRTLAMNLFESRRRASRPEPARSLVDWLDNHPDDADIGIVLAQWYQFDGQTDAAVKRYEKVLTNKPDNIVALNNLALLYHDQGNPKALATARRAYEVAPDNPAVMDTIGWIQLDKGQVAGALKLLKKAASAAPKAGDIQYHLAVALSRTDQTDDRKRARQILASLLESKQPFEARKQARALLDKLGA